MWSRQKGITWPYLAVLGCLFVLSVSAPRAWHQVARKDDLADVLRQARKQHAEPKAPEAESAPTADSAAGVSEEPASPPTADPEISIEDIEEIEEFVEEPAAEDSAAQDSTLDTLTDAAALPVVVPPVPALAAPLLDQAVAEQAPAAVPDVQRLPPVVKDTEPADTQTAANDKWPEPTALIEQLAQLETDSTIRPWAARVREVIETLCALPLNNHAARDAAIGNLERLAADAVPLSKTLPGATASRLVRTKFAIERRLTLWKIASRGLASTTAAGQLTTPVSSRMAACVADVQTLTERSEYTGAWRKYLLLDELRAAAAHARTSITDDQQRLARRVLARLASTRLTPEQRTVIGMAPVRSLRSELQLWIAEPISVLELLEHVEQFEDAGLQSDARALATHWPAFRQLAAQQSDASDALETYYRNANLRIVVAGSLLNRMVPQPDPSRQMVRDTILDASVRGRSTTFTKLAVQLVPDEHNLRMGLEASGVVASSTASSSGPATFHSTGQSSFLVRKLLVVDRRGMRVWPAVAEADSFANNLVSVETDYDMVPLFGSVVRNMARSRHDEARGAARYEVEQKVASRARTQLDSEVEPRLVKMIASAEERIMGPLKYLDLEVEPVALSTTTDRLTMRLRLAEALQLGAHTARPQAPSTSVLSVQVHESVINNAAEKLNLDGQTFKLPELFKHLAGRLSKPELASPDDLPDDVQVTFAPQDAVHVRFAGGQVEVELAFAELKQNQRRWHDFTVRAFYRAASEGRDARLVRSSVIQLDGESLRGKAQIVLRSIFSKVLSRERQWSIIDPKYTTDPRLADLEIAQLVIEEGWIGLAYAPIRQPATIANREAASADGRE